MIIRAKAPLRIGFAGGGTDVSPYCDTFGGSILNATINMYAYVTIETREDNKIILKSIDRNEKYETSMRDFLPYDGNLDLLKAVYNRMVKDYKIKSKGFKLVTYVEAPTGSGLGSSSTLVVAIVKAFMEWNNIPITEYDIAKLAWSIEREDMQMSGGLQDQYAAAFGGFNFMEFQNNQKVIVNSLRIHKEYIDELEFNTLLYYTGTSRLSSMIIDSQITNVKNKSEQTLEALHNIKQTSYDMKNALLTGCIDEMGSILNEAWQNKKATSSSISNPLIDKIYMAAINAGATGGKISGAGGGGFFVFYCPNLTKYSVINALQQYGGEFRRFAFTKYGVESWKI